MDSGANDLNWFTCHAHVGIVLYSRSGSSRIILRHGVGTHCLPHVFVESSNVVSSFTFHALSPENINFEGT